MLSKLGYIRRFTGRWRGNGSMNDARPVLEDLTFRLQRESEHRLNEVSEFPDSFAVTRSLHLAIDHMVERTGSLRLLLRTRPLIDVPSAVGFLDAEISQCERLLEGEQLSGSTQAASIATRTLNLLFRAKQQLKRTGFRAIPTVPPEPEMPVMAIPTSMLYQLHHSLFPAERMIVGAGRRVGRRISIPALFDVTGRAGAGGVLADPDRLGRALIAMSETDTHFALWIHSHPGGGPGMTHPSEIDVEQHADWLRDYSPDLVSAIMVRDRYIRFWGTAVECGRVAVAVEGPGTELISASENIYRLEY